MEHSQPTAAHRPKTAVSDPQREPKSMIAKLADAQSTHQGLQLVVDIVSALGGVVGHASLLRAGHSVAIDVNPMKGLPQEQIEGHFGEDITLQITCIGDVPADLNAHLQTIVRLAAVSAERWARRNEPAAEPQAVSKRMIGNSSAMADLYQDIARAARSNHSVLIKGESGTGKTTTATMIHEASARTGKPFVDINCATIPETLLESELFGYEKGAFTGAQGTKKGLFEIATGGTLFLDEIAEMKVEVQAKLLKAIEQKKIRRVGGTKDIQCDVRIVAASSRNLQEMVKRATFREDLYYRLAVLEVHVVSLRERRADIPALIQHCLSEEQRLTFRAIPIQIENKAIRELSDYAWPGNIRQLQNCIARLVSRADESAQITVHDVRCTLERMEDKSPETIREQQGGLLLPPEVRTLRPDETLQQYIHRVQLAVINATNERETNLTRTACRLGYNRSALSRLLKALKTALPNDESPLECSRVGVF